MHTSTHFTLFSQYTSAYYDFNYQQKVPIRDNLLPLQAKNFTFKIMTKWFSVWLDNNVCLKEEFNLFSKLK